MTKDLSLFDPSEARGPSDKPDVGKDVTQEMLAGADQGTISVSTLVGRIKTALTERMPSSIAVVGELSNVKRHSSGHLYFRLKDAGASIDAAMFKPRASKLKFTPVDGLEVVVEGRVDIYAVRGQLQFYAERITPRGAGELDLALRQLITKLRGEGLFDQACKKSIPRFPRAIGLVTSRTGAALRDIRRTLGRRWPGSDVYLLPVLVQGDKAAKQIAEAIAQLDANAKRYAIDTLIVARGGGSLEDLWAFNEEIVARAIYAARTPIISGVGHEVDTTIADMVADLRAPTPTGAAEVAVPDAKEIADTIAQFEFRLRRSLVRLVDHARGSLEAIGKSVVFRDPTWQLRSQAQRIDELSLRLRGGMAESMAQSRQRLAPAVTALASYHPARLAEKATLALANASNALRWALRSRSKLAGDRLAELARRLAGVHPKHPLNLARQRLTGAKGKLEAMGYRQVLARGFSVTRMPDGGILRSLKQTSAGDLITTELADGTFSSTVSGNRRRQASDAKSAKQKPDMPEKTLF